MQALMVNNAIESLNATYRKLNFQRSAAYEKTGGLPPALDMHLFMNYI